MTGDGEWTLDGDNLILGEINMKRRSDMFQISVQDLADQTGNWTLSIFNEEGTSQGMDITHMNSDVGLYLMELHPLQPLQLVVLPSLALSMSYLCRHP